MGESLYGKFGADIVNVGVIILLITYLVSVTIGWIMPAIFFDLFFVVLLITIVGIVFGIVGIIKDDSKEKAIRALIAGICFLIVGIAFIFVFYLFIDIIIGN